ncbi:hypothetical protein QTP86_020365 [Hemibagrus guttatus]|nr:hypothetical protein QTP86_020365 [Hemibagrus guttatus]
MVKSTKFLGVHLAENFTWSLNTTSISMKAQQHLYFLRRLRKAHLPPPILTMFYRGTIESILSSYITAWFGNCTVSDCKTIQLGEYTCLSVVPELGEPVGVVEEEQLFCVKQLNLKCYRGNVVGAISAPYCSGNRHSLSCDPWVTTHSS